MPTTAIMDVTKLYVKAACAPTYSHRAPTMVFATKKDKPTTK